MLCVLQCLLEVRLFSMQKLDAKAKLKLEASGFLAPFIGFGGWGMMTVASTLISVFTGFATNGLNIVSSTRRAAPSKPVYKMSELQRVQYQLFNSF